MVQVFYTVWIAPLILVAPELLDSLSRTGDSELSPVFEPLQIFGWNFSSDCSTAQQGLTQVSVGLIDIWGAGVESKVFFSESSFTLGDKSNTPALVEGLSNSSSLDAKFLSDPRIRLLSLKLVVELLLWLEL